MWFKRIIVSVLVAVAGLFAAQAQPSEPTPQEPAAATQPAAAQAPEAPRKELSEAWADMERQVNTLRTRRPPAPADTPAPTSAPAAPALPATRPVVAKPAPADTPAPPRFVAPASSADAASTDGGIRLQYDNAPINFVVRSISEKMGRPLIGDYNVEGTITFFDAQPYTLDEAFDTVNILLAMRSYRLVAAGPDDRFLQLIPLSDIGTLAVPIYRGLADTTGLRADDLATVLIPLKYIDADEASKMVVRMVSQMGTISPMARSKGILITDAISNIRRIHELLQMVDTVESTEDSKAEILELTNARARDVATVIENLWGIEGAPKKMIYDERRKRNVPVAPDPKDFVRTTFDDRTNILVIAGEPGKMAMARAMVERMDSGEEPVTDGNIRVFKLTNAKAQDLVSTINGMFGPRGRNRQPAGGEQAVRVVADRGTNRLIVSAPADKMARIEELILSLDEAGIESSGMRVFKVKYADPNQLGTIVTNATKKRDPRGRVTTSLTVSADARSKTLIVAGDAADIDTAAELIKQLDTDETEIKPMEVRVIHVEAGDVRQLSQSLLRVLSEGAPAPSRGRRFPAPTTAGGIRIEADIASNNLMIAAPTDEWPRIEKVLADLQAATATAKMITRTIPLKAAKANEMAQTLQRVLIPRGGRRSRGSVQPQIQIAPSRQANALVVTATAEDHQKIADLIVQLDVAGEQINPITMIELTDANAEKVAMTLKAMIPRTGRGQSAVSITADAAANVVLLRGPAAEREMIEKMIARLDEVTGQSARETRIHRLKHASASALAPIVTQMYAPGMSTGMSRNRGRRMPMFGGDENRVIISAAPGDKALVIDAPSSKMDQIVQLIVSLDTDSGQTGQLIPRSYSLQSADANQLARSLTRLFAQPRQFRPGQGRAPTGPQPKFEAEQRTNTLLVTATAEQYEQIEPMIEKVDGEMIEETKIIPLRYAKAADLVDVIRTMLTGEQVPMIRRGRPQMGQRTGGVHVAAMTRTNSLIVQGPPDKLALAEQLVASLDVEDGESRTVIEVVALTSADATSLAQSVTASIPGGARRPGRFGNQMATSNDVVTVTAEPNSNSVIVRGPAKDVPAMVDMIRRLDGSSDPRGARLETIRLVNNDAAELAAELGKLFRDIIKQTPAPGGRRGQRGSQAPFTISADTRTNSLVVSTTPAYFAMLKELVDQLEKAEVSDGGQVHHITLVNADAYDLAEQLRMMFRGRKGPDAPIIEGDFWTNSLTIIAKDIDYKKMQSIIEQMDQVATIQVRVMPAGSLRAEQLAAQLLRVYRQVSGGEAQVVEDIPDRKGAQPGGREMTSNEIPPGISPADDTHGQVSPPVDSVPAKPAVLIAVDKMTNSLIVSGTRTELDSIEDLIFQLSMGAQSAEAEIRWYKIASADPASVAATLNTLFNPKATPRPQQRRQQGNNQQQGGRNRPQQPRQAPAPKPVITVAIDLRTRHVIVRAKPADLDMIDPIVKQLDQVTTVVTEVRTIPLKNTDATEVAANLREVFRLPSGGRPAPRQPQRGRQPTQVRAEAVRQMLEMLGPDGERVQVDVTSMVAITANRATNSIIVSAPADAMKVVIGIVQELDQSGGATNKPVIRLYPVTGDNVAGLAQTMQSIFTQSNQRGPSGRRGPRRQTAGVPETPMVITADAAGKLLIVSASADQHELVASVLADVQAAQSQAGQAVIRVYKIRHADARQVATTIQSMYGGGSPGGVGRGPRAPRAATSAGTLKVTADTSSNSMVVSATAEQHERIAEIVTKMDTPPGGTGLVHSIALTKADAASVAKVLTRVFVPAGGNRRGGGATQNIVIEGSSESRTLLVRADDETFERIKAMAEQMDSAGQSSQVFLLPLTRARAGEMAVMVMDLYKQQVQAAQRARTTPPDPMAVTADEGSNALILACTPEQFERVSQWVNQVDETSRGGRGNPRIISIDNADPAEVEQAIRQLFGGSAPVRGGRGGGTLPFEMSVLIKQRQLMIDASDEDYATILQLVATLDEAAKATRPEFKLFELKHADNTRMAQMLTQMFTRMRQPGRPEDNVTVTALPQTTAIVVAGTAERIADAARLIAQLDTETVSVDVQFKIFALEHAQPSKVIALLDKMLAEYRKANPNQPIGLTADEATRSLVVTGRPTAFAEIEKILRGIDVAPITPSTEVRIIPLLKADAKSLADVLNEMLRPSSEGQVTPEARILQEQVRLLRVSGPATGDQIPELDLTKPIKIDADPSADGSNSLIISSTAENVEALAAIIAMMDTVPISEAVEVRIVQLKHADAASVLKVLREIFSEGAKQLRGRPGGPVAGKADPVTQPGKGLVKPLNVSADPRTNMLVLSGAPDTLALAQKVIADLDRESGDIETEVRLFKLAHADAGRLADVLAAVFAEDNGDAADEGLRTYVSRLVRTKPNGDALATQFAKSRSALTIQPDESTNTLVIAARRGMMPLIADVIRAMDIPGAGSMNSVRIIPLKFADASRMADIVKGLYSGANSDLIRAEDKPTVEIDPRTNSLIISASDKTFDTIAALVGRLDDKTPIEMRDIRLVPLQNADAGSLAATIQEMMDARVQRQESLGLTDAEALRVLVIPDLRSNSLIVGGSPEGFELVKTLAEQLDGASPALSGTIQILPLKQANAGTLGAMLQDLFDKRYNAARTPDVERQKPIILPDLRTNSLLVAANQDDSRVLADLLRRLDVKPTNPAVRLVVIGLAYNDAGIVGPMLEEIFDARLKSMTAPGATPAPQDEVDVSIDALNNAMIISASLENLEMIRELLTKVDVEPSAVTGVVRMYRLENADAERISGLLSNLISDGLYKPGMATADSAVQEAREKVSIVADVRTNVLIVSASRENFLVIEEIIKTLDSSDDFGALGDIRLYTLKHAEASKVAPMLRDFFQSKRSAEQATGGSARALEVTVIADIRTNTLLVAGGRESFKAIEVMIAKLDADGAPRGLPKVFGLRKAEAAAVVDTITDLYVAQGGLEEAGVSITADERTNAVVVTGGEADLQRIEGIIRQLDNSTVSNITEIRVFILRQADATELADLLTETLTNKPKSPTGDGDNRQMLIEFIRHTPDGARIVSRALQEGVLITPDTRANALVVVAAKDAMGLLTNLIEELDSVDPPPGQIRLFRLVNADARQMADVLAELFGLDTTDAPGASYTLTTPASGSATMTTGGVGQSSMTVTVDGRTNTLLVGGSEQLVNMAEKVIQELDAAPGQERVPVVYHLRYAKATDIADAIGTWLDDEDQRLADAMGDDRGSGLQLLEQKVSVVAVTATTDIGDQSSETSSTLLISASPRNIDRILAMVDELDEPPPQVHIGVIMVEVTLDDSMELGVDWDLDVDLNASRVLNAGTFLGTAAKIGVAGSGLNLAVTGGDLNFFLQALHGRGQVEILARPTITAIDNHAAEISIGQNVPFVANTNISINGNVNNTVTYREVGIILKVTPRISPDGFVLMEVSPEISSLTSSSIQLSEGVSSPIFNSRTATTTVSVRDGHTIVIGGLITTTDDFRETKIPILGDIPYLGYLFKRTVHAKKRTEFLMMLTPRIIRNSADAAAMTRREYERTHLNEGTLDPYNDLLMNGPDDAPPAEANTRSQSVIRIPTGRERSQLRGNVTVIGGTR